MANSIVGTNTCSQQALCGVDWTYLVWTLGCREYLLKKYTLGLFLCASWGGGGNEKPLGHSASRSSNISKAGSPTSVNAPCSFSRTSVSPSSQDICSPQTRQTTRLAHPAPPPVWEHSPQQPAPVFPVPERRGPARGQPLSRFAVHRPHLLRWGAGTEG
ncbi:unnamed protein product [Tetraodon nigroviridis]|uniref:(spotted green pufferfish) hypothetical protein n=1 Tax=Tetraodon nigroviridis TaxID=99883 RepID=Q4SKY1_TETNG|nr:unnamed protein product [Tetraodon nigroviridis]